MGSVIDVPDPSVFVLILALQLPKPFGQQIAVVTRVKKVRQAGLASFSTQDAQSVMGKDHQRLLAEVEETTCTVFDFEGHERG